MYRSTKRRAGCRAGRVVAGSLPILGSQALQEGGELSCARLKGREQLVAQTDRMAIARCARCAERAAAFSVSAAGERGGGAVSPWSPRVIHSM